MHYFLFDYDHPQLRDLVLIGPPCTQRVVRALERLDPVPTMRLIRGKVLPEHECYRLAQFRVGGEPSKLKKSDHLVCTDSFQYEPDEDLFKIVICDLAETLSVPPSTVAEEPLLLGLAKGSLWAVGASAGSDDQALQVDVEPFVVEPDLVGNERWSAIYERGVSAGEAAAQAVQPSPMLLEGARTIWEGVCGFGVTLRRRPPFID